MELADLINPSELPPQPDVEPWMTDALCAETDPEMFFPEKGGSTKDAKRTCHACPVAGDCLGYALRNDERFGIWGGLSERERRKVRRGVLRPETRERSAAEPVQVVVPFEDRPVNARSSWTHGQNARMKQLVKEGAADKQIAKAMGVSYQTVYYHRNRAGLLQNLEAPRVKVKPPRRRYRRWTDADLQQIRDLHAEGLADRQIAKRMDRDQPRVTKYRAAMRLPALHTPPGVKS